MYEVTVEGRFSAAHRHAVRHPDTTTARDVHGHDFLVLVRIAGAELQDDVLVDFHDVELALHKELEALHYSDLNQLPEFAANATPAAIARWLFDRLQPTTDRDGLRLRTVEVHDTENTGARFEPDPEA